MKTNCKSSVCGSGRLSCRIICVGLLSLVSLPAQNLFVSQGGYILDFNPDGTYSTLGTVPGNVVSGMAFNSAGDLFVTLGGVGMGAIYEFTPGGVRSTFASGLNSPISLAFNNVGTLFMGDSIGNISDFTPGGVQSTFASGLEDPYATGLAFNSAGDLFVGESYNSAPNSGYIDEITPNGVVSTFASGLEDPYALAFNSSGDLFAADFNTGYIYEYAPNGARSIFASGLKNPEGMAFNSAGDLFVTNSGGGQIIEFTPGGVRSTFTALNVPDALAFQGVTLPVPEPSAWGLLIVGTIGFFVRRRSVVA
jgi:glucose/arabinose dehydrogenase